MLGSRTATGTLFKMTNSNYKTGVCYALLDTADDCHDHKMRALLHDANFAFDSIINPIVGKDLNELLSWANKYAEFTHLAVFSTGTHLVDPQALRVGLHKLCEGDWLIAGYIKYSDECQYPSLAPDAFVLNLDLWRNLGMPEFGLAATDTVLLCPATVERDALNNVITVDQAKGGRIEVQARSFGWNIISKSLEHYRSVVNFDASVTEYMVHITRGDPVALIQQVEKIRAGYQLDASILASCRDSLSYAKDIDAVRQGSDNAAVFVFNTGHTIVDKNFEKDRHFDALWNTASGFKSFGEWWSRGADSTCQINTFDYNSNSLRLWKHIHYTWDGVDLYDHLLSTYPFESDESFTWGNAWDNESAREASDRQENEICEFLGGKTAMKAAWRAFQCLEHRYHRVNLVENPTKFAELMSKDKIHAIWLNNIFYYSRSIRYYGSALLHDRLLELAAAINEISPNSVMHGQGPCGHFESTPSLIIQDITIKNIPTFQYHQLVEHDDIKPNVGHPTLQNENSFWTNR